MLSRFQPATNIHRAGDLPEYMVELGRHLLSSTGVIQWLLTTGRLLLYERSRAPYTSTAFATYEPYLETIEYA